MEKNASLPSVLFEPSNTVISSYKNNIFYICKYLFSGGSIYYFLYRVARYMMCLFLKFCDMNVYITRKNEY